MTVPTARGGRPTVARIETFALEHPLPKGGYGASKVVMQARVCTAVKVTTSDGVVGWGESFGPPRHVAPFLATFAEQLIGTPVDAREGFLLRSLETNYVLGQGGTHVAALSGLDIALWDAQARTYGVPLSHLLGGAVRDTVQAYASTGYVTPHRDLGEFREQLQRAVDEGFTAAKIKVGTSPQEDRARTEIARETLGADGTLMVDYNGSGTPDTVSRSLRALLDLDPYWVEEPLPPVDHTGWGVIRDCGVPIAAGEALATRYAFRDPIAERRYDIVQPDLTKCGGYTEALAVVANAVAWNVRISPHCWGTGIAEAAVLQLLAHLPDQPYGSTGGTPQFLEFDRGPNPLREAVLVDPIRARGGRVDIPDAPGLGVAIAEDVIRDIALPGCSIDTASTHGPHRGLR
ncbi:mandelate racemase/muconate lactonizing enzyme family protein [Streptomyces sp. NPDC096311]|uniref:mandelate racemase/muconate lactonizing enzyme family protein n=1 Tax=Streptomyces sp. NPDC096311 TaxID=3366083 RepID=UPI00380F9A83